MSESRRSGPKSISRIKARPQVISTTPSPTSDDRADEDLADDEEGKKTISPLNRRAELVKPTFNNPFSNITPDPSAQTVLKRSRTLQSSSTSSLAGASSPGRAKQRRRTTEPSESHPSESEPDREQNPQNCAGQDTPEPPAPDDATSDGRANTTLRAVTERLSEAISVIDTLRTQVIGLEVREERARKKIAKLEEKVSACENSVDEVSKIAIKLIASTSEMRKELDRLKQGGGSGGSGGGDGKKTVEAFDWEGKEGKTALNVSPNLFKSIGAVASSRILTKYHSVQRMVRYAFKTAMGMRGASDSWANAPESLPEGDGYFTNPDPSGVTFIRPRWSEPLESQFAIWSTHLKTIFRRDAWQQSGQVKIFTQNVVAAIPDSLLNKKFSQAFHNVKGAIKGLRLPTETKEEKATKQRHSARRRTVSVSSHIFLGL